MSAAIPDDVLREIFIRTLPTPESFAASHLPRSTFTKPSAATSPLVPCSVCARWRHIAISHRRLWAYLDSSSVPNPQLVHRWIERSGTKIPLSLSLRPSSGAVTPRHLHILLSEIGRCQNLELFGVFMLTGLKCSLPTLQSLSVSLRECLRGEATEGANWFSAALSHCPLLTRLHWDGPMVTAPWAQITYLSLRPSNRGYLARTLPQLVNLVELHLSCPHTWKSFHTSPLDPCALPTVTTFGIQGRAALLDFITLPALQHLVVVDCEPGDKLDNLLGRSNCHLKSIEIQSPSMNNIHGSFNHPAVAPSLRRLTTTSQDLTHWLPDPGADGLELLRTVDLSFRLDGVNPGEPSEAIAAFIHSRLPALTVLELDLGLLARHQLESRWVTTSQGGFTVTRPTHLRVEYEDWLGSDEGLELQALWAAGSEEGKQLFHLGVVPYNLATVET
ncbi:hypothetical protein C8F04DRAFT_1188151 [Mycena alexandri]|uniref:F-box domain-containing protein n=1 Tax=Mycena alexandri TaxID=1745969 RepID=A0AAD6SIV9_9AGAR|nr:hypothetical protein C8F04DRAFT_1188151 [Mycena alexandri]